MRLSGAMGPSGRIRPALPCRTAKPGPRMRKPILLPGPFRPGHGTNRMRGEGDVGAAREYFIRHRPSNLAHLLSQRFSWMNEYIQPGTRALELGCGAGFSQFYINQPIVLSDVEMRPWVNRTLDALSLDIPDESFEVIICSHMLHHLAKP